MALLIALSGCGDDGGSSEPEVTSSITLVARPDKATVKVGATVTFAAQMARAGGAWDPVAVQWQSNNPSIATIDPVSGVARGVAPGFVAIEGRYGPGTAFATLEVVP